MKFWIDVEDLAGNKLGDGPINNAVRARIVTRLDRIGSIEFDVPATDSRAAALLRPFQVVRIWGILNNVVTELGAGIIQKRTFVAPNLWRYQGDDLFIELMWRLVHGLAVWEEITESPDAVWEYQSGVYTDLPLAYDNDTGTVEPVTLLQLNSYLFIRHYRGFNVVEFVLGDGNLNATDLNYGFSDERGPSVTEPTGQWRAPGIESDTTIVSDAPLAVSGEASFTRPGNWQERTLNSATGYYLRLDPEDDMTEVELAEVYVKVRQATTDDLTMILAYAPAGWSLDTDNGYGSTINGTFSLFADETVFNAFVKTAEKTREHFRRGVGRTIVWLQQDQPHSGVRAVARLDLIAAESNPNVCHITALEELEDATPVVSRIYPKGKGNSDTAVSLFDCSAAALATIPAGYTVNTTEGYIRRDALEAGTHPDFPGVAARIEHSETWSEIGASDNSAARDQAASDELLYAAFNWLQQHDDLHKFYNLSVTGLRQILKVGEKIRVEYRKANDEGSGLNVNINADLIMLETTLDISEAGLATTGLKVSTTDRYPENDDELLARRIEQLIAYRSHGQSVGNRLVR